jgi:hypothetical protein
MPYRKEPVLSLLHGEHSIQLSVGPDLPHEIWTDDDDPVIRISQALIDRFPYADTHLQDVVVIPDAETALNQLPSQSRD